MTAGEDLAVAVRVVTGDPLEKLEERWRGRITFWHGVFPILGSSSVLWGATSILFLFAGFKRRRQNRRKIRAMAEAEAAVPYGAAGGEVWRQEFLAGQLDEPFGTDAHEVN